MNNEQILQAPLMYLRSVGERRAKVLEKELSLRTFGDLIEYFPYRYVDRTKVYTAQDLHTEMPYVQVKGEVIHIEEGGNGPRKWLKALLQDRTGVVELIWFNSLSYFKNNLRLGVEYVAFGKPKEYNGSYSISHPEIELANTPKSSVGSLYPIYTITERMRKQQMGSRFLNDLVKQVFERIPLLSERLPDYITKQYNMLSRDEALRAMHHPQNHRELQRATLRLKLEELFYLRLKMRAIHAVRQQTNFGLSFPHVGELFLKLYHNGLPFDLTTAQKRVLREIHSDMKSGRQMNRLIQGDVGSGKTVVALLSMLLAVDNGMQACMMAPTEILAQQHYHSITSLTENVIPLRVELLTGTTKTAERRRILSALEKGEVDILVGTHILIQEYVRFKILGLAVIDEQHRFGVCQRSMLWEKNSNINPHILIMSATPIPRTLAMTLYGDLDVSVLDELPPGRTPIITSHVTERQRSEVMFFIQEQLSLGRQAYVVYPAIEENEQSDLNSVEEGYRQILQAFPAHKIGVVHGRLKAEEKEETMKAFALGEIHILVATTVIEVGVNVPNASVMLIDSADRFGLSQLHQLRGRVGRGSSQSYCLLMTRNKLGNHSLQRINVMCASSDGFFIAEEDLRLRGYGDMDGTAQSGISSTLKIANIATDSPIVRFATNLVNTVVSEDATLVMPKNSIIRDQLITLLDGEKDWGQIS